MILLFDNLKYIADIYKEILEIIALNKSQRDKHGKMSHFDSEISTTRSDPERRSKLQKPDEI